MNKNFAEFLKEVKKNIPNAVDDDIISFIAENGIGSIEDFILGFKKEEEEKHERENVDLSKQVLNATLAMDDEVIRMVWNMAKVATTDDNISQLVFSLNNTDDLNMIRETLGGDVFSKLARYVLGQPNCKYITLAQNGNLPFTLVNIDTIKESLKHAWDKLFPFIMSCPSIFTHMEGHDTDILYYDEVIAPIICNKLGVRYCVDNGCCLGL